LFDGVAALALGTEVCLFEGQPAMLLESACHLSELGHYEISITESVPAQLDWRPLVRQILRDRGKRESPGVMAMRFHRGLASAIIHFCNRYLPLPIVFGGGVFQNKVLLELLFEQLSETDQRFGLPGLIPPNDGGLAAGQLAVSAALARRKRA
jgi:hydrogenase maturation protein HypF